METKLTRIAQIAKERPKERITLLLLTYPAQKLTAYVVPKLLDMVSKRAVWVFN